jgi:hypothetical protein
LDFFGETHRFPRKLNIAEEEKILREGLRNTEDAKKSFFEVRQPAIFFEPLTTRPEFAA